MHGNVSPFHHRIQNGSGAGPPSLLSMGTKGSFLGGVRRPGREDDHSSPSSAEVKE
jgi:hypothetical protein